MQKITEADSLHQNLENKSIRELLEGINQEDRKVPEVTASCISQIEPLVEAIVLKMSAGGRLFYLGAGTSGRLGIVDASELPPTYGIPHGWVIGLIAGGDEAIRKAVEFAEDDWEGGWNDLLAHHISTKDVVIGIAASGTTPYVVGALEKCRKNGIITGCITCNPGAPIIEHADYPIVAVVGPEFVTGSTRMKAGTAQKLILNMISTTVMIQLGRVQGNKMVDMQLTNHKLVERGTRMIMEKSNLNYNEAKALLLAKGSVRKALESIA
ncbi:MAG: N-acetylmuramic acid 6-phosphate etherase [Flavobacteriales bacterium]|nr:N-acetylmuramic acid 6-phosphate etherase [Flavobacteriales bacterium]